MPLNRAKYLTGSNLSNAGYPLTESSVAGMLGHFVASTRLWIGEVGSGIAHSEGMQ